MVLGVDLSDEGCRISYLEKGMDMPEALSQKAGMEVFEYPMVIARARDDMDWQIGKKALSLFEDGVVQKGEGLIGKALRGDVLVIFGCEYEAFELLLQYLLKLLSMSSLISPWQSAERICICCEKLDVKLVELLKKLVRRLDYPPEQVDFIDRSESFYEYVMHQKEELWNRDVLLLDCTGKGVVSRRMSLDRKTRPAVCNIQVVKDPGLDVRDDDLFMGFCEKQTEGHIITSVFIAGEQVSREAMPHTMRALCKKRRGYYAHNVYAKGACHAAMDRLQGTDRRRSYLYLGHDKLKNNVGLRINRGHEEVYLPLVDAGINWYDVRVKSEIYLGRERELRLLISPLTGKNERYVVIRLGDIPQRPDHTTRVRISLFMESEEHLCISVEDLGFGEIFPSSGITVTETIPVAY